MTFAEIAADLEATVTAAVPRLRAIGEDEAGRRAAEGKWCGKEILGHLIDSAVNNHQRFVRLQYVAELVLPGYEQNEWVAAGHYGARPWVELVELWAAYNRQLAHVVRHANEAAAGHVWKYAKGDLTLGFVMRDYVDHMHHHLRQICGAEAGGRGWNPEPWL
jgi:DinB superfamily